MCPLQLFSGTNVVCCLWKRKKKKSIIVKIKVVDLGQYFIEPSEIFWVNQTYIVCRLQFSLKISETVTLLWKLFYYGTEFKKKN
jgi:capsule polysaccharide modification protein KpsS